MVLATAMMRSALGLKACGWKLFFPSGGVTM